MTHLLATSGAVARPVVLVFATTATIAKRAANAISMRVSAEQVVGRALPQLNISRIII